MTEPNGTLRKKILEMVGQLAEEELVVPLWGTVIVRELTGKQSREFEIAVARGADAPLGFLLQMSLVDPETKALLFEPADRAAIEELGMASLKPVIELTQKLSGLSQSDVDKAKASLLNAPGIGPSS